MKYIKGYEGLYSVTEDGQVWSHRSNKFLKQGLCKAGYFQVVLSKDGTKSKLVHLLVLDAYVGDKPTGYYGCHNDGNKFNNHYSNLRYDTPSNNQHDRKAHGTAYENKGIRNGTSKLTEEQVREIRELYATGQYTQVEIGKAYGIGGDSICRIVNLKRWSHI